MARRVATTILLIKSDAVARADFSAAAKPELISLVSQPRAASATIANLVESALQLVPAPVGRKVWVLCEDLWMQMLSLTAVAIAGIDDEQLSRALSFEAEPLSGIPAFDSAIAFQSLPSETSAQKMFCVTAIEQRALNEINAAIQKARGKLGGVLHPGALPRSINENSAQWRRLEFWDKTTLCINDGRISLIGANFIQERTRASVSDWIANAKSQVEILESDPAATLPHELSGIAAQSLQSREILTQWLCAWAECLSAGSQAIPIHIPKVASQAGLKRVGLALLAQAAVLAICLLHAKYVRNETNATNEAVENARKPSQRMAELSKQCDQLDKELKTLRSQNRALETEQVAAELELSCRKKRIAVLLQRLASERPEDLVIQSISAESDATLNVKGLSLEPGLADELVRRLTAALAEDGWEIRPGNKQAQQIFENGGPWQFTVMLKPTKPPLTNRNVTRTSSARAEIIAADDITAALPKEARR